jgi:hypothetical protein
MASPYLEGLPGGGGRRRAKLVLLVAALVLCILFLIDLLSVPGATPAPTFTWTTTAILCVLVGPFLLRFLVRRLFPDGSALNAAEVSLLRGDVDRAIAAARELLKTSRGVSDRFGATMLLGRCAERRGDFADAEAIFARARDELVGVYGMYKDQMLPLAAARRAFALAALGRLDDAEAEIARTAGKDALPGTRWLAVRAQAVTLARRARHRELAALLDREASFVRRTLTYRDRLLMRVLSAFAMASLEPTTRAAGAPVFVDEPERAWIGRVVPEALPRLGVT